MWRVSALLTKAFAVLAILSVLHTTIRSRDLYSQFSAANGAFGSGSRSPILRNDRQTCRGSRGVAHEDIEELVILDPVLEPYAGSYSDLGLEQTWSTAEKRYEHYRLGPDDEHSVDRAGLDWSHLQNECLLANVEPGRGREVLPLSPSRRLRRPTWRERGDSRFASATESRPKMSTGRTAVLYRGWDEFVFKEENILTLRSLITETALRSKGDYTVFYLVDVKGDFDLDDDEDYDCVLGSIPAEFRNMTVLFDQTLLKAWYPKLVEHRAEWQMEQARQVFAHIFDEFDHYWTIELDVRFTGNAGKLVKSFENFALQEPRKQARERSSYFMTSVYNTYANFSAVVNTVLDGGSAYWRGVSIPDLRTAGPKPPTLRPEDDDFSWGVGEEADLILLSNTFNVTLAPEWHYKTWISPSFQAGTDTPRIASPVAISRCSWNLLNLMHTSQAFDGLAVPSEATPSSFGLWSNMKISRVPFPIYGEFQHFYSDAEIDLFLNGGPPSREHDGMAWGRSAYGEEFGQGDPITEQGLGATWSWKPGFAGHLFDTWKTGSVEAAEKLRMLQVRDGEVLMPNLMLHPVKSGDKPVPGAG